MKIKVMITLVIIIVIVGCICIYLFEKKKTQIKPEPQKQAQQTQQAPNQQVTNNLQSPPQKFTTVTISGKVSAIAKDSIEITNGEAKNTFSLTSDIVVLSVNGAQVEKKTIADIKKDQTVSAIINQANSQIISIQIQQGTEGNKGMF
jgi:hypothetical protein